MVRTSIGLVCALLALSAPQRASAIIFGGIGNAPVADPGWPSGGSKLINHPGRVAWWEGPPFGGGEWHAECRGDAKVVSAALGDFARVDAKVKRVVVHDGAGRSFWLTSAGDPSKAVDAGKIDWSVAIWQADRWQNLRGMASDLNPTSPADASPPAQFDVYAAGVDWSAVKVPEGVEVVDRRLSAHGYSAVDGVVAEGGVTDLSTGRPMAARVRLERVEPRPEGGYAYPMLAEARADDRGHWVVKKVPPGWTRVVVEADGFAPRVAGYERFDDQPRWVPFDAALARSAAISGRVVDEAGRPIEGADVRPGNIQGGAAGGRYELPEAPTARTDAEGRFRFDRLPAGSATLWASLARYYGPGLGVNVPTPRLDVEIAMKRCASLTVSVEFGGKRPGGEYLVSIKPEGGEVVGSYGGSSNVDANGQAGFEVVPPGRYLIQGRPNPSTDGQETAPMLVELKGGDVIEVTLKAR